MRTTPATLPGRNPRHPFLVLPSAPLLVRVACATPTAYAVVVAAVVVAGALDAVPTLASVALSATLTALAVPVRDRLVRRAGRLLPGVVVASDDASKEVVLVLERVRWSRAPGRREVVDRFGSAYLDGSFAPPTGSRVLGFHRVLRLTPTPGVSMIPDPTHTWVLLHAVEVAGMVEELDVEHRRALAAAVVDVARVAPVSGAWPSGPDDVLGDLVGRERVRREVEYLGTLSGLLRSGVPHEWAVRHLAAGATG